MSQSAEVVSEDLYSSLFNDADDERWVQNCELLDSAECSDSVTSPCSEELVELIDGYLAQCRHHAVVLILHHTICFVGQVGLETISEIIHAVLLEFKDLIRHFYNYILETIHCKAIK